MMYSNILSSDEPRFVEQPIYDTNQPQYDENGDFVCYKQIGTRTYDLAPQYEWVSFVDALELGVLIDLKRSYAWERNHPLSRARFEQEQREADERKEADQKRKRLEAGMEGFEEAMLKHRKKVQFGYGETRNEK